MTKIQQKAQDARARLREAEALLAQRMAEFDVRQREVDDNRALGLQANGDVTRLAHARQLVDEACDACQEARVDCRMAEREEVQERSRRDPHRRGSR